jgi:hypothetical protein
MNPFTYVVAEELQLRLILLYGVLEERQILLRYALWDSTMFSCLNELSRVQNIPLILPRYETVVDICWQSVSQQGVSAPHTYATLDDKAFLSG